MLSNINETLQIVRQDKKNNDIVEKAYYDALYEFHKTLFRREFNAKFQSEGIPPLEKYDDKYKKHIESASYRVSTKPPYIMITINVRPNENLKTIKTLVEKLCEKPYIESYKYVYEVRAEAEPLGLHCHFLAKYTCRPYDLKTSLQTLFKNVCDVKNPHCLNLRYIEPDKLLSKVDYLLGKKQEKKLKSYEFSKKFREKHELKEIYSSPLPLLPLLGNDDITIIN